MARLKEYYEKTIRPQLIERFGYKNPMEVPRLEKIVLNMGWARRSPTARSSSMRCATWR